MMRTTVNLPDDVYEVARSLACAKNISFGQAIAELVRKGLEQSVSIREEHGFPRFAVSAGTPPITLEQTLAAEDDS
jgi:hypothetical protein